jgi:hypothetical protein
MQRRYLRATIAGQEVDVPTSNFIPGQFVRFIGGFLVTATAVRGPVSSTLNAVARWDVITGDLIKDSTVLIDDTGAVTGVTSIDGVPVGDWVRGPTPATATDNAVARWDATTGRLIQNSVAILGDTGNISGLLNVSCSTINSRDPNRWVDGPLTGGATNNHVALWDTATGRLIKDSLVNVDPTTGDMTTPGDITPATVGGIGVGVLVKSSGSSPHPLNAVARWNNGAGNPLRDSTVTLNDSGNFTGMGTLNTRTIANWVDGPASATNNALAAYNGTSGKLIKSSSILLSGADELTGLVGINGFLVSRYVQGPGIVPIVGGNLVSWNGTGGRDILDAGVAAASVVAGPSSATDNAVARFDGTGGKLIQNSVVIIADTTGDVTGLGTLNTRVIANWVDGPASATDGAVALFNGATGKAIQSSGIIVGVSSNVIGLGTLNTRTIANWVDGPASATDNAVARFSTATGKLVKNSAVTIDDSGNITGVGSINSRPADQFVASATSSVANFDIALWSGTMGRTITGSGIQWNRIAHVPTVFSTDNAFVRVDASANTYTVQQSTVTLSDTGDIAGVTAINSIAIANYMLTSTGNSIGRVPVYNSGSSVTQSQVVISAGGVVSAVSTLNGIDPATWVVGPSSATDGRVAVYDGATGKLLKNGTKLEDDVVTGPVSSTDGLIAVFNGITGKIVKSGTRQEAALVAGPSVATDNAVVRFDATTGKLVQDSAVKIADSTGDITGAGKYNGFVIGQVAARQVGGSTPVGYVFTTVGTGVDFNIYFYIPYSTSGSANLTVSLLASSGFNQGHVMCGSQGGAISSNGGVVTLLTTGATAIPTIGFITVVTSLTGFSAGATLTATLGGTGHVGGTAQILGINF